MGVRPQSQLTIHDRAIYALVIIPSMPLVRPVLSHNEGEEGSRVTYVTPLVTPMSVDR